MDEQMREMMVRRDLRRLREMGVDTNSHWMYDVYRDCALAGEFDHLSLFVRPGSHTAEVAGDHAVWRTM